MNRLKELLAGDDLVVAPGVFDGISARIADTFGFDALYMTGYGVVASSLGLPDAGLASYTEMVGRVSTLCSVVKTPLIADGDTGYGGLLNVQRTVRGYEAAGAAGIQLEDQEFPKKCGHTPGRRVVPADDMVGKIRVAVESRDSADFLIVARTDARTSLGLDEALRRAELYGKAGADILFIESPETEAEMEKICRSFDLPLLVNVVDGGRTPVLSRDEYRALGYSMAIFPATAFLAVGSVLQSVYSTLKATGASRDVKPQLADFMAFSRLMGFEDVWEFERKHADRS
jgi:2,3-dimethylmalate lyase